VLDRSLLGLRDLIGKSIEEVRSSQAAQQNRKQIVVAHFIEEIGSAATLEANARGLNFVTSAAVQDDVAVYVDRQVLNAVVGNLLQNAFKFTRPHSTVRLGVRASADRVLIDVQDECGGLPGAGADKELPASFEQRAADRTGLGIGLTFSRWGAEVSDGRLYAYNVPGDGCIFTLDLPRASVTTTAFA
jgi:K+-sensing histidine kinase KdpD